MTAPTGIPVTGDGLGPGGVLLAALGEGGNRSLTAPECEVLVRLNARRGSAGRSRLDGATSRRAIWQLLDGRVPPPDEPIDTVQVDTVQVEPVPIEAVQVDTVQVEPVPIDTVQVEPVQIEAVQVDTVPIDTVPIEPVQVEPVQVDTVPIEPVQVEAAVLLLQGMLLLDDPK